MIQPPPRCTHFPLIVILLCVAAWIGIPGAWIQPVWGATAGGHDRYTRASTAKHHRIKGTSVSLAPATIRNFRVLTSPDKTRLVIDLDRQTKVIEHLAQNPSRVVLAMRNAAMDSSAQVKAVDGTVPAPFTVVQSTAPSVLVSLPTAAVRTYKHFTLSHPPRLVVDITPPIVAPQIPVPGASAPPLSAAPFLQPVAPPAKGYTTIVIDPGHGGKDPGALGLRHTEEKDITLKVGLQLRELLRKQPGVRVLMTREQDVFVELEERARFANKHEADLFVSIHVNSHPSRAVKGIEIYQFGQAKDQRAL